VAGTRGFAFGPWHRRSRTTRKKPRGRERESLETGEKHHTTSLNSGGKEKSFTTITNRERGEWRVAVRIVRRCWRTVVGALGGGGFTKLKGEITPSFPRRKMTGRLR